MTSGGAAVAFPITDTHDCRWVMAMASGSAPGFGLALSMSPDGTTTVETRLSATVFGATNGVNSASVLFDDPAPFLQLRAFGSGGQVRGWLYCSPW